MPISQRKIRGGKLEVTAVKCRLLGWWSDESKGYRLEDVETGKLISSRDVRFIEDERPTELAVIDNGRLPRVLSEITSLDLETVDDTASTLTTSTNEPKWASLPPREPSTRRRTEPTRFGEQATEEEIVEAENRRDEHHAYVVYASEPQTYKQAMSSTVLEAVGDSDARRVGPTKKNRHVCVGSRTSKRADSDWESLGVERETGRTRNRG
jgi:hypothetical protein